MSKGAAAGTGPEQHEHRDDDPSDRRESIPRTQSAPPLHRTVAEEQFRLLVGSVKDYAIFMLDTSGHVASWNAGARLIKGYAPEEILGQHISVFYLPEDQIAEIPQKLLDTAARDGRVEAEGWRVRKDGSVFWADVVMNAMRDATGRHVGFAKITRDLTERRKMDEDRVKFAQAEEALRLRDEFLSIASHELKTPLTVLQLQLQSLVSRKDSLSARLFRKVELAMRASHRMGALVDSLLDVSRVVSGQMLLKLESFDLTETARELIEQLSEAAEATGCTLCFISSGPVRGRWDRLRIEQILTNLLGNAFKYAAGTPVVLTIGHEPGVAVIEVRDGGPGFPKGDLTRLFRRFERASPPSYGGLGLGLYVASQIAEAHGGTIAAANNEETGARMTVRLPLEPTSAASRAPVASS